MNSRRRFIKQISGLLMSPIIILTIGSKVSGNNKSAGLNLTRHKYKIPGKHGIYNFDEVLIRLEVNSIAVFTNRCSYCGSRLIAAGVHLLYCTEDSSKYNGKGEVINGPASTPLVPQQFQLDSETNSIVVF